MVAAADKGTRDSTENAAAVVMDQRRSSMNGFLSPSNPAPKRLGNSLVPQADTQHGQRVGESANQFD
jgi:hypothetical protein